MSEAAEVTSLGLEKPVSAASADEQKRASDMGWTPPEYYKGDPAKFIDAPEFIERGQTVLPILRKTNERLHGDIAALRAEVRQRDTKFAELENRLAESDLAHSVERQKAVEQARAEVRAELAHAIKEGDTVAIADLQERSDNLRDEARDLREAVKKAEAPSPRSQPADQTEVMFNSWAAANPWFSTGGQALQAEFGAELISIRAEQPHLWGYDLLNAAANRLHTKRARPPQKVTSAASGGSGGQAGGGTSYADLPAEARKACDDDAKRFVGKGKRYETREAWNKTYAERYFSQG